MSETPTSRAVADRLPAPNSAEAASLYQRLRGHLGVLKLADAAEALPSVLDQAAAEDLSMTAALERLLSIEVAATEARRLTGRLRFACLPTPASLEDFDFDNAAGVDKKLIDELATCRYLETATNVLLIGPPGVGKTHLSVGLARAAAHAGYRTYFTTAADLAARCHRAAIEGRWATTMRFYAGPTLLAIGLAVAGLGYAGVALVPSLFVLAAGAILVCFGSGLMLPNMLAWTMRSLPAPMRGRGMGLWTGSFFLAQFLAPLVLAAFTGLAGSLSLALIVYALAAAAGALAAFIKTRSGQRAAT